MGRKKYNMVVSRGFEYSFVRIWSNWGDGGKLVPLVEAQIDRKGSDGLGRVDRKSLGFAKTSN